MRIRTQMSTAMATVGVIVAAMALSAAPALALAPAVEQPGSTVTLTRGSALLAFAVNSENSSTVYWLEYGTSEAYGSRTMAANLAASEAGETVDITLEDLVPGTVYHYRLVGSNSAGAVNGPDGVFTTMAPSPPSVSTGGSSGVGQNTATISGTVNAQGEVTNYGFEIGTGAGYGLPTGLGTVSSGEEALSLVLTGLQPGSTYHYRVQASNLDGTTYGPEQTFTTAGVPSLLTVPVAPPLIATPAIAFPVVKVTTKPKGTTKKKNKKNAKKAVKSPTKSRTRGKP
jgi:hypothetical protein